MTTATNASATRKWFAEPMVWLVLGLPAAAVLAGVVTAVVAWRDADGPVADDTYRKGLAIGEELARRTRASELGLVADIDGGLGDGDTVRVRLRANAVLPAEAVLELRLVHPGRRGADRSARLARTAVSADGRAAEFAGTLFGGSSTGPDTPWRVVLAGRAWRLDGDVREGNVHEAGAHDGYPRDSAHGGSALRWHLRR